MARLLSISSWCRCRLALIALCASLSGCGTTRWSDTTRTATEQLLVSDAVDRAVSQIDFTGLAGRNVYLETKFVAGSVDEKYLVSTLRQHMLATGCIVKDKPDDANYIVEVRAGAVGTNRNDLLCGMPATNLPTGGMFPLVPTTIPEIPLMKRTNQQGVCKVAVFAYDRLSGRPVWQSGTRQVASKAKDIWVLGTGPFQRGTIYEGTKFAGERLDVPLAGLSEDPKKSDDIWVSHEILFSQPAQLVEQSPPHPAPQIPPPQTAAAPSVIPWPSEQFFRSPAAPAPTENRPAGYFEPLGPPTNLLGPGSPAPGGGPPLAPGGRPNP